LSRGQSIIGFTEAELGFFVALVLIGLYVKVRPLAKGVTGPTITVSVDTLVKLSTAKSILRDSLRLARRQADSLKTIVDSVAGVRRIPTCQERGIIAGDLDTITVLGGNSFVVDGETYDLLRLRLHFQTNLEEAREVNCLHMVSVRPPPGLEDMSTRGQKALQRYFYVRLP
jgi:hypothetical protein